MVKQYLRCPDAAIGDGSAVLDLKYMAGQAVALRHYLPAGSLPLAARSAIKATWLKQIEVDRLAHR